MRMFTRQIITNNPLRVPEGRFVYATRRHRRRGRMVSCFSPRPQTPPRYATRVYIATAAASARGGLVVLCSDGCGIE